MDFTIFLSLQRIYEPEAYSTSVIDETRDEAVAAQRLGYTKVWVPEHHLIHFMQAPSATLLAQHVGQGLDIRIGTMATLLTTRHPLVTAGELALADHALGGRLDVGVGRGAYEYEFHHLGVPFDEGRERFAEALSILRQIWDSELYNCSFSGKYFDFENAAVWPRPVQQPHPPLWIAAMTPPTVEWAASEGFNVANWPFIRPMSAVADTAKLFHEARGLRPDGGAGQKLTILRAVAPTHSEEDLERRIDEVLINHRINQRLHFYTQNADPQGYVAPEPLEKEPSRDEVRENLIFGSPKECLEKVEEYAALGVDELMLYFDFGPSHEDVIAGMELFSEEVMKPFQERHSGGSEI
jgi:alkanesulfonate monooxygenase SsuD/methylene tetrahydromethanopterin reductase-like flavin-dependent oxidoreductase (luciferase family)